VEEKILLLQEKKLRLSADFIAASRAAEERMLTREDVDVLFG
jgi:SNF2 family DNA or RNA helicase